MSFNDILKADSVSWFDCLDQTIDNTFSVLRDNKFYRPVELAGVKGAAAGFYQFESGKDDPEHCFGCLLGQEKGTGRKSWLFIEGAQDISRHVILQSKDDLQRFKYLTSSLSFAGMSFRQHAKRLDKVLTALQMIKTNPFTNDPSKAARIAGLMIGYAHERVAYLKKSFETGYRPKIEGGLLSRFKGGVQSIKCIRIIDQAGELENYSASLVEWFKRFARLEGMTNPAFYTLQKMNPYSILTRPGLSFIIKNKLEFLSTIEYDEDEQTVRFCLFNDFADFAAVVNRKMPGQASAAARKQITAKSEMVVCGMMIPSIIQWLEKIAAHPFVDDPRKAAEFARRALLFVANEMIRMLGEPKLWDEFFSSLATEKRSLIRIPGSEPQNVREMRWMIDNQSLLFHTRVGRFLVENSWTEAKPAIPENPLEERSERASNENMQVTVLKQKLAAVKSEARQNSKEVARLSAKIKVNSEQIEQSENARKKLIEELASLQQKNIDKTEQYEQLKCEVDGILQENLSLGEDKERHLDMIKEQKRRIAELEATVEALLGKGNINKVLKDQLADLCKLRKTLQNTTAELEKVKTEKDLAEETIRKLSQSYAERQQEAAAGRNQLDERKKVSATCDQQIDAGKGNIAGLLRPLIFWEPMSATDSLKLIETIFPDRVTILEPAWVSAAAIDSNFSQGKELAKTLFLLATDYLEAYLESGDVKARTVFGTKYSSQESERVKKDPKLVRERTFEGILMQRHLKIGYAERLYFKVDSTSKKVIIGYCGAHLSIVSR